MRLTEPMYSIAAVGLALLASAAAIPVLASESYPESDALQRLQQTRFYLIHSAHNYSGYQDKSFQETKDVIRDLQRATGH